MAGPVAPNVVQRIWGIFDPVSGALKGVTTSGETPYFPLLGSNAVLPTDTGMGNGPPNIIGGQVGTLVAPTSNAQPLVSYTVYSNANTGLGAGYVGGAIWGSCYVVGGAGYGKGITGYCEIDGPNVPFLAGSASIAVHAFGRILSGVYGANICSGWDTSHDDNPGITVTGCSGTGTVATLTFSAIGQAPPVNTTINVSGMNPSAYNGNFQITASSTTSVSYASAATGAFVSGGLILTNQCFGHEIDLVMNAPRVRSTNILGFASGVGLWINNQSNANGPYHGVAAIGITQSGVGAGASQWWSGIFFQQNCCVPGLSELVQMNGGSVAGNAYSGLRLQGWFNEGIDMSGALFTGATYALIVPNGTANGGNIGAVDSGGVGIGTYNILFLNNASPNNLIIGATVPGNIVMSQGTQFLKTIAVGTAPGANINVVSKSNATLTGTGQVGIQAGDVFSSAATVSAQGISVQNALQAAAFVCAAYTGISIINLVLGGGSSVTTQFGLSIGDLTSGTNNVGINLGVTAGASKVSIQTGTAVCKFGGAIGVNGANPPAQVSGFGTPTGTGVIANFPGATATLAQATQAIAQLITDIKNFGLYAA